MSIADDLVEAFRPWLTPDLDTYLRAVASMFEEVEILAFDLGEHEGWTILFDVSRCRNKDLPYLAMVVGERLPAGLADLDAREWIEDAPNSMRGTISSIIRAAQRTLTGARHVSVRERWPGDDVIVGATWRPLTESGQTWQNVEDGYPTWADLLLAPEDAITVVTYLDETPEPAAVEADLLTVLPADLHLNYETLLGQTWLMVSDSGATWQDIDDDYPTWGEVRLARVGYTTFSRPRRS